MEPSSQPLSAELLSLHTCNCAYLDIKASGGVSIFFFHCKNIYSFAPLNRSNPYCQHECAKWCEYEESVFEVEDASLSPLVFSTSGGMGAVEYKLLAFLLSGSTPYSI